MSDGADSAAPMDVSTSAEEVKQEPPQTNGDAAPAAASAQADDESKSDEPESPKAEKPKKPKKKQSSSDNTMDADVGSGITERVKGEKRQRKQTEFLKLAAPGTQDREPVFEEGPGTALGDIENVQKRIGTLTTKDASLKRLYRFVFNVPPKETTIKSHLRKFSGFAKPLSDKERKALASKLEALTLSELRDLADVLDTDRKSNKPEYVESIIEFLHKPKASGNAYRMKSKSSGKKSSGGSAAKKAKTDGAPRGKSAYIIFSTEVRAKVKAENPSATFGELGKLIGEKWGALSEEKKQKYKDKAAESTGAAAASAPKKRKSSGDSEPKAKKAKSDDSDKASASWDSDKVADKIKHIVKSAKDPSSLSFKMIKIELLKDHDEDSITAHKDWIKAKAAEEISAAAAQ